MKATFRFEGGRELAAEFNRLSKRLSKQVLTEALKEGAEPMRKRMEMNAPVGPDAPHLRDAMVISTSRGQDAQEAAVAVGATRGAFYGSFQEFGTAHHAPQPWARPAFDQTHQESLAIFAKAAWRSLAARGNKAAIGKMGEGDGGFDGTPLQGEV
jgi:HK97 gp10 family phage protein